MTLHPQAVAWLDSLPDQPEVHSPGFGIDQMRERRATAREAARTEPREHVEHVSDHDADGVPVRLYRPVEGAPVVLHLHGGGWVFGDVETYDRLCRYLAATTGWAVLSVDYRLAPEHPYPAGLDDCETAAAWLRLHAEQLAVDASTTVVVGDSAGANLVAGLVVRHPDWFALQVLVYPCLDPEGASASYRSEEAGLSGAAMDWFWSAYVPEVGDRGRPDVAAGRADLAGQPRAIVFTAEHDPLRDEGERHAERLAAAGVPVVGVRWQGMVHGFWRLPHLFDASRAAIRLVAGAMEDVRGA